MHALHRWIHWSALALGTLTVALVHRADTQVYAFPAAALLASLWLAASSRAHRRAHGVAPAGALALGALSLAPLVFAACLAAVSEPFAFEVAPAPTAALGDPLLFGGLFAVALPAILWRAAGAAALAAWPRLVAAGHRAHTCAAAALLALASLVVALAAARAFTRPPVTRPLAALVRVAALYPLGAARSASGVHVHRLESILLRAQCREGRCTFQARPASDAPFVPSRGRDLAGAPSFASSAAITLYRGPDPSLWVLAAADGTRAAFRPTVSELPLPVAAGEVAPWLAPPASWLILAACGVALGAGLLVRAQRARGRWTAEAWREGSLADNVVTLHEDGRTFPLAPGTRPPPGEVVVRRAALFVPGGGYRADPSLAHDDLRPGTLAGLAREADAEALRAIGTAVVPPALTAAPLLAARLVGLW